MRIQGQVAVARKSQFELQNPRDTQTLAGPGVSEGFLAEGQKIAIAEGRSAVLKPEGLLELLCSEQ